MRRVPPKSTIINDLPREPTTPNAAHKSRSPDLVVQVWSG